ncbi:hypothetical protein M0802_013262 [Mischocyttarus mexicanus]|nr:hypothetical protein M0802_013265 [Mischocyttarus mexicanus]KAI4483864.1 hypothetical protein M0802_013262 [Mischocyttarus mexicanus]
MSQGQQKTLVKGEEHIHCNNLAKLSILLDLLPKKQLRNQKKIPNEEITENNVYIDYPLDIWFIISEYIKPETIGKFACICKSSYYVTTTAKFWFHLYKTYYKFVPGIPERLQPHWMILRHELRLCVIRTLHYTYFAERRALSYVSRIQQKEPHSLVKRQCSLMWHRVRCLKYSKLPLVIGLMLQKVLVTLMPGLKYLRLQLGFGTSDFPNALTNQVILNDVIDYEILDWWHPRYPHQDTISYLCDVGSTIQLTSDDTWD